MNCKHDIDLKYDEKTGKYYVMCRKCLRKGPRRESKGEAIKAALR